jgi:hypothetical protein
LTVHIAHLEIMEAGLYGDCPRCEELANDPVGQLDSENMVRIFTQHLYSDLDRMAYQKMSWIAQQYERLQEAVLTR